MPTWLEEHLQELHEVIRKQEGQLALALTVLVALGFRLEDFADLMS